MPSLRHTIKMLKIPLLQDGEISLGETSLLLRAVRPFVQRGDATASELQDLLNRVRKDGVVTEDESCRICRLLDKITDGGVDLGEYVLELPDYPTPGFRFLDTSRLFDTPWLFKTLLDMVDEALEDREFDLVVAPAVRGIVIGAAIAGRHGAGFVPVRLPGKLPRETVSETYESERGPVELQMHADAVMRGERVLVVDDLVATGATALACARLAEKLGGQVVGMVFPVELEGFGSRCHNLKGYDVLSVIKYSGKRG